MSIGFDGKILASHTAHCSTRLSGVEMKSQLTSDSVSDQWNHMIMYLAKICEICKGKVFHPQLR